MYQARYRSAEKKKFIFPDANIKIFLQNINQDAGPGAKNVGPDGLYDRAERYRQSLSQFFTKIFLSIN
jgi:hypothetical protein